MYRNRCVTSNVYFRGGALILPFLGGLGWPDLERQGGADVNSGVLANVLEQFDSTICVP